MTSKISVYWDGEQSNVEYPEFCYRRGGLHPIILGDVITADSPGRHYRILHKLGRGAYATVWLAETLHLPSRRYVALKVCAANADSQHELKIFHHLPRDGLHNVIRLLDSFSVQGPNGVHAILVQDVVGQPTAPMRSLTRSASRVISRQLAQGLADLHRHGVVHGDFHLGNVGVALPTLTDNLIADILSEAGSPACTIVLPRQQPSRPQTLPAYVVPPISIIDYLATWDPTLHETRLRAMILDLGSAVLVEERRRPFCTLTEVCAPELVFEFAAHESKPSPTLASDIWSFACTIYEFVIGSRLFGGHCVQPNSYLLSKMARLCGEVPPTWRKYWESQDDLRSRPVSQEVADYQWQYQVEYLTTKNNTSSQKRDQRSTRYQSFSSSFVSCFRSIPSADQALNKY